MTIEAQRRQVISKLRVGYSPGDYSFILPGEPFLLVHTAQVLLGSPPGEAHTPQVLQHRIPGGTPLQTLLPLQVQHEALVQRVLQLPGCGEPSKLCSSELLGFLPRGVLLGSLSMLSLASHQQGPSGSCMGCPLRAGFLSPCPFL